MRKQPEKNSIPSHEIHEFSERLQRPAIHNLLEPLQKKPKSGDNPMDIP